MTWLVKKRTTMNEKTRQAAARWRKFRRVVFYSFCALLLLLLITLFTLSLPVVQQAATQKAARYLQQKFGTRVEIGAIRLRFPYYVSLEKFLLEDQQGDTLARVGSLVVSVDMWRLMNQTIELQKISLEDAGIYLHRKDSIYNFDFIVQAFVKPKAPVIADTTASAWQLQLDMTALSLQNVYFLLEDDNAASTTQANIGTAETVIAQVDMKTLQFVLDGLRLADADIRMVQKKRSTASSSAFGLSLNNGEITRSYLLYVTPEMAVDASLEQAQIDSLFLRSANNILQIQTKGVRVDSSAVAYRDPVTPATPGHFNAGDLAMTRLNASIPNFSFQNDTLVLLANAFSAIDKSGIVVHALQASTRVTSGSIEVKNAVVKLNQTVLDGDILLSKTPKATFDKMQIQLRQVKGIAGDLLLLLPPQESPALSRLQDIPYEVSGTLNGWLDNLQTENIQFRAGSGTVAAFTGSVQQLSDPAQLGMRLNISHLETNRTDLVRWMSVGDTPLDSLLVQPLPAWLSASGNIAGTLAQLQLALHGEAAALQTGRNFSALPGPNVQFDVAGTLSDANDPDHLGMDLKIYQLDVPGNFFTIFETKALQFPDWWKATGTISGSLAALQTDLTFNAIRDGATSHLAFKGMLKNIQTPDQWGFDVSFDGALTRAEILGYVPDSVVTNVLRLPGLITVRGTAKGSIQNAIATAGIGLGNLGNINIAASLRDTTYQLDLTGQNLRISQLAADTSLRPLQTVGFTAQVNGRGFGVGKDASVQLVGVVDSVIWDNLILRDITFDADVNGRRFKGGFQSPDERAAVRARTSGDFTSAIPILDMDISLNCMDLREFGWTSRPTTGCMHIRSHSEGLSIDTLSARVNIENIDLQYDTVHIHPGDLAINVSLDNRHNNIDISSDWLQGTLKGYFSLADLSTTIGNIAGQYFVVDRTTIMPPVSTDSFFVHLHLLSPELLTTGLVPGLTDLGPVYLEGALVGQRNYFSLLVQEPKVVYRNWEVDSLKVRAYAGDTAALFVLTSPFVKRGDQPFVENAVLNGQFQANVANVSFKANSNDGRERFLLAIQAMLQKNPKETVISLAPRQIIDFKEWAIEPDNKIYITPAGTAVQKFTLTGAGQSIQLEGSTRKLAGNKTGLDFALDIDRLNYNNFDIFLAGILRNLDGWGEGHLKINGTTDAPQVRGKMQLHETFFTPVLTNVRYGLSETPFVFTDSGIVLDGLTLRDPDGKTLDINGQLSTIDWTNIQSNLTLHADRWQALHSSKKENPVYFGELYVSLDGTIKGPLSQPDIQLVVKTAKESTFTYVYDVATQALQHEGIVYFLPPPRQNVRPIVYDAPVNIQPFTLSASIEIDSNLTINSVINPVTGDDFRGNAIGKLQFNLLKNGNMTLAGQVELVRGVYNYSYQSVVKRSFEVTNGSTITWTGDMLAPELALKARYRFRASPYPLVVNQLSAESVEETAKYRKPQTFFLQTTLNGSAMQPDVSFQFIYPTTAKQESLGTGFGNQQSDLVQRALSNVNQDKNLLSRQVFGVLLLRNFIGETIGTSTAISGGNPLQSGLSSFLTSQINALADQYLTWIDVDLATTEGATNTGASQAEGTTNYQLRLQKSFFEDRLTFKLSGGTTVGGGESARSGLDNASVEYALNRNGELKITIFSEKGFELLNASSANLRNSGAGLILAKEFGGSGKSRNRQ